MMKLLIMFIIVLSAITPTKQTENLYPMTTIVTDIDYETETVTVTNFTGFKYQFYGYSSDWDVGDICSCIMSDKGTPHIFDDEIITVKYDGWIEGFEERIGTNELNK